ncbi:MAG: hypothetical protein NPIRA04_04090 [Nitrospirales bacterium]|nr:MAG: hypothetical protein NPIRA04_04090 [Nitrospirales bacterium]
MPKSEDSSTTPYHFACSWQQVFDETQWGTSVPTKLFLWNNPGVYVDYCYPDPNVPHFKDASKFLGTSIQKVLPGDLGEHVYLAVLDAERLQQPVIGTYSLMVEDRLTTVVIRFLPMHRHVLGLVHDFPSTTHPSIEQEEDVQVSPDLIDPSSLRKGPFSESGMPHIQVSIPLKSDTGVEETPIAQHVEETLIRNLASTFELEVTGVTTAETRSLSCSGSLQMTSKFLLTLKAIFPPESTVS